MKTLKRAASSKKVHGWTLSAGRTTLACQLLHKDFHLPLEIQYPNSELINRKLLSSLVLVQTGKRDSRPSDTRKLYLGENTAFDESINRRLTNLQVLASFLDGEQRLIVICCSH